MIRTINKITKEIRQGEFIPTSDEIEIPNDGHLYDIDKNGKAFDVTLTPEYIAAEEQKNLDEFNKNFFEVSIGFVRRKVFIKGTGETGDFLKDFLSQLLIGFYVAGQDIQAIIYEKPPMNKEVTDWEQYKKTIVWDKATQAKFLSECSAQSGKDFFGV